jgi:uncharacterized membrane protein
MIGCIPSFNTEQHEALLNMVSLISKRLFSALLLVACVAIGAVSVAQDVSTETPVIENTPETFGLNETALMLGRFHPIVLHFPIGLLVALFLLECLSYFKPFKNIESAHWLLLILGAGTAVKAAAFGLFLSWEGGYDEDTVFWHQWTGIGVAVLAILALVLRFAYTRNYKHIILQFYRLVLFANVILISIAGHYGGNLTHGSTYLFENMPEWMPMATSRQSSSEGVAGSTYADVIQPIFESKCYECHGEEKNKGDYKMTTRELLLTSGESGNPSLVAGDAMSSMLVRVITLPGEHEADAAGR